MDLPADRRLKAAADGFKGGLLFFRKRRQPDPGMPEVRIDIDAGDGQQGEAIVGVGQPLDGLAEDLPEDLVDPRRSGIGRC